MRVRLFVSAILLVVTVACGTALASPKGAGDARAEAAALFHRAEREDAAYAFADALAHYEEARALDPGSRFAPRAEARAAILRAHREGGFKPFAALERVRRDPALADDPEVVKALVRDAEGFPPGRTRVEVWMLAAEADAARFGDADEARALYRRVLADAHTEPVLAGAAARDLVRLSLARGDLEGAREAVRLAGPRGDRALAADVARAARRRWLHGGSIAVLLLALVMAGRAAARAPRAAMATARRAAPFVLLCAAYVGAAGALLASAYQEGTAAPFVWLGAALAPLLVAMRVWGGAGSRGRGARVGRAALAASSALAAAFLVLERLDAAYLSGLGL